MLAVWIRALLCALILQPPVTLGAGSFIGTYSLVPADACEFLFDATCSSMLSTRFRRLSLWGEHTASQTAGWLPGGPCFLRRRKPSVKTPPRTAQPSAPSLPFRDPAFRILSGPASQLTDTLSLAFCSINHLDIVF